MENNLNELEALLQQPLNPEATDQDGQTALQIAVTAGHSDCLKMLLEADAEMDIAADRKEGDTFC